MLASKLVTLESHLLNVPTFSSASVISSPLGQWRSNRTWPTIHLWCVSQARRHRRSPWSTRWFSVCNAIHTMKANVSILLSAVLGVSVVSAEGIPEPGIVFYGSVTNAAQRNGRVVAGSLRWTVSAPGSSPITLTAPLSNLDGRFSYRLRIPFESLVGGNSATPGTFILNGASTTYSSGIKLIVNGREYLAVPSVPSLAVYNFNAAVRGVVNRLDFQVNAPDVPILPGSGTDGPGGDDGGGTPGLLQFTAITPHVENGVVVQWTGAPKDRGYVLVRAQSLETGLSNYEVLKSFPASPTVSNSFWDTNTVTTTSYFYQLLVK